LGPIKIALPPPHFIELLVPSQEGELSSICVNGIEIAFASTIFLLEFGTVLTV
jgi:hypothetical protein